MKQAHPVRGGVLCLTSASGQMAPPTVPELVAARALRRAGRDVTVVLARPGVLADALALEGARVAFCTRISTRSLAGRLRRPLDTARIARLHPDAVCVLSLRMSTTPFALAVGGKLGTPVLTCLHGYSPHREKYAKYGVPRADGVMAVSRFSMECYADARPAAQVARVVHNGIDAAAFRRQADEFAARARLGIETDVPLVGMAGAYVDKGLDVFVRAAAEVRASVPAARFVVAGGFRDAGFETEIRAQVAASGLTEAIDFVGQQPNVAPFMAACDVWVLPTRVDAFPMVALEAMAVGRPLVASRVGGLPEIVVENETGRLVERDDETSLARAVVSLLEDEPGRLAMGARGRERVETALSLAAHETAFLGWMNEVLGTGEPTGAPGA